MPAANPTSAAVADAQARHDAAASAYGAGMARFEAGQLSARELGILRGKATRAENALAAVRHAPALGASASAAPTACPYPIADGRSA